MINELKTNMFAFSQGIFNKNGKDKKYRIKVSVILENNDYVENYKEFELVINDWDISFYDHLIRINEDEIDRFKNSKKYEGRV
ncbi:MAG: hypothetical protein ACP5L4_07365 [Thermoplasmata archaeon]